MGSDLFQHKTAALRAATTATDWYLSFMALVQQKYAGLQDTPQLCPAPQWSADFQPVSNDDDWRVLENVQKLISCSSLLVPVILLLHLQTTSSSDTSRICLTLQFYKLTTLADFRRAYHIHCQLRCLPVPQLHRLAVLFFLKCTFKFGFCKELLHISALFEHPASKLFKCVQNLNNCLH